jgi:hypothetical protein
MRGIDLIMTITLSILIGVCLGGLAQHSDDKKAQEAAVQKERRDCERDWQGIVHQVLGH